MLSDAAIAVSAADSIGQCCRDERDNVTHRTRKDWIPEAGGPKDACLFQQLLSSLSLYPRVADGGRFGHSFWKLLTYLFLRHRFIQLDVVA